MKIANANDVLHVNFAYTLMCRNKNPSLNASLYEVRQYMFLTEAFTRLEKHGMTVPEQLAILTSVKNKLSGDVLAKLEKVLEKNPD